MSLKKVYEHLENDDHTLNNDREEHGGTRWFHCVKKRDSEFTVGAPARVNSSKEFSNIKSKPWNAGQKGKHPRIWTKPPLIFSKTTLHQLGCMKSASSDVKYLTRCIYTTQKKLHLIFQLPLSKIKFPSILVKMAVMVPILVGTTDKLIHLFRRLVLHHRLATHVRGSPEVSRVTKIVAENKKYNTLMYLYSSRVDLLKHLS